MPNLFQLTAALAVALALPAAAAAKEPASVTGTLEGARYRIDIPVNWNGDLVLYYHGYEVRGEMAPDPFPLSTTSRQFLMRGYAVAASGYSQQGWAVEQALVDTDRLRRHFERQYGKPKRLYAAGGSMGGHLALATVEQRPDLFDGAVTYCGANLPATALFREVVDALTAAEVLFPGALPTGPRGLDDPAAPAMLGKAASEKLIAALDAEPVKTEALARRVGVAAKDLPGTLWLYYAVVREMRERAGGFPVTMDGRYAASASARDYLSRYATLTGRIQDPVVALSNAYDDIVPVRLNSIYPELVRQAGRGRMFRQLTPVGSGHCNFTAAQAGAAFDALTAWVERGARP